MDDSRLTPRKRQILKAIVDAIKDVVIDTIELVAENITSQVDENKLVFDLSVAVNGTKRPHTDFTNNGANADAEVEVEIPVDSLTVGENQTVKVFYRDGSAYGKDMDA